MAIRDDSDRIKGDSRCNECIFFNLCVTARLNHCEYESHFKEADDRERGADVQGFTGGTDRRIGQGDQGGIRTHTGRSGEVDEAIGGDFRGDTGDHSGDRGQEIPVQAVEISPFESNESEIVFVVDKSLSVMDIATATEEALIAQIKQLDEDNKKIRRANTKLKGEVRHLKRVIAGYKEDLGLKERKRYRNKNHQGRRSR